MWWTMFLIMKWLLLLIKCNIKQDQPVSEFNKSSIYSQGKTQYYLLQFFSNASWREQDWITFMSPLCRRDKISSQRRSWFTLHFSGEKKLEFSFSWIPMLGSCSFMPSDLFILCNSLDLKKNFLVVNQPGVGGASPFALFPNSHCRF